MLRTTPKIENKRKRQDAENTPVHKTANHYIARFKHAEFFTIEKQVEVPVDDVSVEDLIDLVDASYTGKVHTAAVKREKARVKPKSLCTDEEKMTALSGKIDHQFNATVRCESIAMEVTGGACQNNTTKMQDSYDVAKLSGVSHLNESDLYLVAYATAAELHEQCTDSSQRGGSTYLNVTIDLAQQRIITTQLGDSEAWLYWTDKEGKHHVLALHDQLHTLFTPSELKRVQEAGHETIPDAKDTNLRRLQSGLAVTRSLGDHHAVASGLLHVPTVSIRSYRQLIQHATCMQVFLGTDGLFALDAYCSAYSLRDTLAADENQIRPTLLTKKILKETACVNDNAALLTTSLVATPLTISPAFTSESAISLSLFDGHGKGQTANTAAKLHYEIQQTCINEQLKKHAPGLILRDASHEALDAVTRSPAPVIIDLEEEVPVSKAPSSIWHKWERKPLPVSSSSTTKFTT